MSAVDVFLADINRSSRACRDVVKDNFPDAGRRRATKRQRHEELCTRSQQLSADLQRLKAQYSSNNKDWMKRFAHDTWPFTKRDRAAFARKRQVCYNLLFKRKQHALEHDQEDGQAAKRGQSMSYKDSLVDLPPGRGRPTIARGLNSTSRSAAKKASQRKRVAGGGRAVKCPEIGAELFEWFVGAIRAVKARVGNDILLAKAKNILQDAKSSVQDLLAEEKSLKTKYQTGQ